MGREIVAIDNDSRKIIYAPKGFATKPPGVYHPTNPFPGMVVMKNIQGYEFEIWGDEFSTWLLYEADREGSPYKDITEEVYKDYINCFIDFKSKKHKKGFWTWARSLLKR